MIKTGTSEEQSNESLGSIINLPYTPNYIYASLSFDIDTGVYTCKADYGEGEVLVGTYTATTTNKELFIINEATTQTINIGGGSDGTHNKNGTDLKYFSITVDGKEVFSGNKTGLDVIKPDNYEVVGNPVITDDGVASGFSDGNYLTVIPDFPVAFSKQEHIIKFKVTSPLNNIYGIIGNKALYGDFVIGLSPTIGLLIRCNTTNNEQPTYDISLTSSFSNSDLNKDITIYHVWNGAKHIFYKTVDGTTTKIGEVDSVYPLRFKNVIWLGRHLAWNDNTFTGSIDLNAFKIYVDGNLVYQPTLRIPYTQSKTNEKIVDATYRNRVQDMYEQFGYTHYHTIGDVPEKYNVQVVGNPTLVGGVASNMSQNNRLEIPFNSTGKTNFKIKVPFKFPTTMTLGAHIIWGNAGISSYSYGTKSYQPSLLGTAVTAFTGSQDLQVNIDYVLEMSVENTTSCKFEITRQDTNTVVATKTWTTERSVEISKIYISQLSDLVINLSQLSIEVDGKEVFRGYEPAITDAFTLATNKGTDVIDSYSDGEGTYYEVRADLVQRCVGIIPINTTEVNYPREFRDEKNIVQVAYFNVGESTATPTIAHIAPKVQTKSGFTIGAATNLLRNYYAEGKAVLG